MSSSKFLSDAGWKDAAAKNKIKDNGLLKILADIKRLGDDKHDESLKLLDEALKLAGQLKKAKEVAAAPAVRKYLDELASAAEAAQRETTKAKSEADKSKKAEAEKKAKADAAKKDDDEDDDDDESPEILSTKMLPLLRLVQKGQTMHTLVAKSGKQVVVMMSRKPIPPARRKLLADQLGGGSTKYYPGHCSLEGGATTFVLKAEVAGMSKLVKRALLEQTGLRVNKVKCRGEDGDDDDDGDDDPRAKGPGQDEPEGEPDAKQAPPTGMTRPFELSASVGRGGKNLDEDVQQVQSALNRRLGAKLDVNGRCGQDTIEAIMDLQRALGQSRPDGRVEPGRGTARALTGSGKLPPPPPPPKPMAPPEDLGAATIARAPLVWNGTRDILDHNIKELKRAIRQEYSSEHPNLLTEIDQNVQRVDVILEKLDQRLASTLERANAATDAAARKTEVAAAKVILADYLRFVKDEPLIDHVDKNPFGVDTKVRKVITDSLTHMAKSIG